MTPLYSLHKKTMTPLCNSHKSYQPGNILLDGYSDAVVLWAQQNNDAVV